MSQTINVSVLADTKAFSSGMKGISGELNGFGRSLQTLGGGIKGVGSQLTRAITAPVLGATVAVGGLVGALGWKRLVSLDTAKGQLKGLGYEGENLEKVMQGVDAGVTGTSLSMADGASIMVGALATGNLALEDTEDHVKRVANVSAAYGVEASHAGLLLNNVLTKNKVTWGDLSQMQANNIPIVTALADHYGVAGDEIEGMAQRGEISIEDLNEVLDKNAGAAAEEYAKTWKGVTENIISNLGKLGAAMLEPAFEIIKDEATDFLELLRSEEWNAAATQIGEVIGEMISNVIDRIQALIEWWLNLDTGTQKVILSLVAFAVAVGPILVAIGSIIGAVGGAIVWLGKMHTAFLILKGALALFMGPVALVVAGIALLVGALVWFFTQTEAGQAIWEAVWTAIQAAVSVVVDWFTTTVLPLLQAAWEGIQAAAAAVVEWFTGTAVPFLTNAWDTIVQVASDAADWFSTHVGPVIEAAIGLVIAIWERAQEVWATVWEAIQVAFEVVWAAIQAVWDTYGAPLMAGIEAAIIVLQGVWEIVWGAIQTYLETAWQIMVTAVETGLAVIESVIKAVTAVIQGDWSAAWEHIKAALDSTWEGMKSIVNTAAEGVRQIVADAMEKVKAKMSEVWESIKAKVSEVWENIKATVRSKIEEARASISSAMEHIRSSMDRVWENVKSAVRAAWESVKSTVSQKIGEVVAFVAAMPGKIVSALGNLGSLLVGAGSQVIDGFISGLTAGFDRVRSTLSGLTSLLPDWKGPAVRDRNILKGSGQLVIEGFVEGLESRYSDVQRSLTGLTRDVASTPFETPAAPSPAQQRGRSSSSAADSDPRSGDTYHVTVNMDARHLESVRTLEDFLRMAEVRSRMVQGVRT